MKIKAGLGMGPFPFQSLDNFWHWVEMCEQSELDSLWHSDRLVSTRPFMEPMAMMAALAGATSRIKFGMNAVVLSFRDPVMLAKQCATIDYLSNGRLLPTFGIGSGAAPEWQAFAYEPRQRGRRANEALEVMTRLWAEDEVSFSGEFYHLQNASVNPKPVQKNFPVWIGGSSKAAQRRTAHYGTGWLAGLQAPESVAETITGIKEELLVANRSIAEDHYGATVAFRFDKAKIGEHNIPRGLKDIAVVGSAADILELIARYTAAGVSKFVALPISNSDEDLIEQSASFIAEVLPEL